MFAGPGMDYVIERTAQCGPARHLVRIEDISMAKAVPATDNAKLITGDAVDAPNDAA